LSSVAALVVERGLRDARHAHEIGAPFEVARTAGAGSGGTEGRAIC
jgi:hypothetical protein